MMYNTKVKIWDKENWEHLFLFLILIIDVYYFSYIISQIIFLILLLVAIKSKKDYYWIAFFFILFDAPGMLFSGVRTVFLSGETDLKSIPFYKITTGVTFLFQELLIFFYILKILFRNKFYPFIFKKDFQFLGIFIILICIYSISFGVTFRNFYRYLSPWLLIVILPQLLSKNDMLKFDKLLFPIAIIAFISQISAFLTGHYWMETLRGIEVFKETDLKVSLETDRIVRAGTSANILLYCFIKAQFYYFSPRTNWSKRYLIIIIFISMLSIFLSGTRGWIIALGITLLITLTQNRSRFGFRRFINLLSVSLVILIIGSMVFPFFLRQLTNVTTRVSSIGSLLQGDITAGGTLSRLSERGPRVLSVFKKSPIIGYGFSDKFFENMDGHVGQQTILLNVGILGFSILTLFFIRILYTIYHKNRLKSVKLLYGNAILLFSSFFIFIYILNSTSLMYWGFILSFPQIFTISLIFVSLNNVLQNIPFKLNSMINAG